MGSPNNVLVFDIETCPYIVKVWDIRGEQRINVNQVVKERAIIAWSAKWLGDPESKTIYMDQRKAKDIRKDRKILRPLWKLLNAAEVVITQNGKNFDCPIATARFIEHKMGPPSPYQHIDTYLIASRVAKFTSNKLEYLTEKLCTKYKKLKHKKFPGLSLWDECEAGNPEAWEEMRKYNMRDVLSTEELYTKLRAYGPKSLPDAYAVSDRAKQCGVCGKGPVHMQGVYITRIGRYPKLHCLSCGSWRKGDRIKTSFHV